MTGLIVVELGVDKPNMAPATRQRPEARPKGRDPLSESNSTKLCRGCGNLLPLSSFSRKGPGKLQSRCKECARAWVKQYREANPEKRREADRRYVERNREKVRERRRQLRQANAEKNNARIAAWKRANPERVHQTNARSRAKRFGVEGFVSEAEFKALCEHHGNRCLRCGRSDVKLTWDHVVPLSAGGPHHIDNIQPLCQTCNSRKADATTDYRGGEFAV